MTKELKQDKVLVSDIVNGKRTGFQKLYSQMFAPLQSFGKKYLEDTLLLEDFIQESFISFWNKKEDFSDLVSIKSFLYTTVKNSCLNYLRHMTVRAKHEEDIVQKIESEHYYNNSVIEEETYNQLYTEIKNLPESSQKIMLLALNGLKNPEIAEELGVSLNTVKTLKKNAYTKLRKKISPSSHQFLFFLLF